MGHDVGCTLSVALSCCPFKSPKHSVSLISSSSPLPIVPLVTEGRFTAPHLFLLVPTNSLCSTKGTSACRRAPFSVHGTMRRPDISVAKRQCSAAVSPPLSPSNLVPSPPVALQSCARPPRSPELRPRRLSPGPPWSPKRYTAHQCFPVIMF